MKICKYCNTSSENSANFCIACGASDFSYKCANCGTVFNSGYCPNCGTKAGDEGFKCPDCGNHYFSAACPNCGYSVARKVSTRSFNGEQSTAVTSDIPARTLRQSLGEEPVKPRSSVTFWKVLLWIFFLPIMLIIAIWKSRMHWFWKIVLTLLILGLISTYGTYDSKYDANYSATPPPIVSVSPSPTSTTSWRVNASPLSGR